MSGMDERRRGRLQLVRRVLLALAGLLVGLGVYSANAQLVMNDRLPMPFGIGSAVVLSGSMEPTLHVNDLVVVRQTQDVAPGDVVVFQSGGSLVVHRVVSVADGSVVTQGDANDSADAPVSLSSVKGVVVFSVPAAGLVVQVFRSPLGFVSLLVLLVFLIERSYANGRKAHERELAELADEIARLRE